MSTAKPDHDPTDDPAHDSGRGASASQSQSFGEEGARLTYGSYLRLPELLSQQVRVAEPSAPDELLFITIHQVYELWFQQVLFELERAREAMLGGEPYPATHALHRVHVIQRVLVEQVAVLETMTPQDFLAFRAQLAPASGFQSVQFREIEFLMGLKDAGYVDRLRGATDDERSRLARRLAEPSLWDAFCTLLAGRGLPMGDADEQLGSLLAVARDRAQHGQLWDVAEGLLSLDAQAALWRQRHVMMVERQIGTKHGTGGSSGAPYLRQRLDLRAFPALWELRGHL